MTRDEFRNTVFERDDGKCVVCENKAKDAHHIFERALFEGGGYYLENGASVCEECHWDCELTLISPKEIHELTGIEDPVYPNQANSDVIDHNLKYYDKWLNQFTGEYTKAGREIWLEGPLYDEDFQRVLGNIPWDIKANRVYI